MTKSSPKTLRPITSMATHRNIIKTLASVMVVIAVACCNGVSAGGKGGKGGGGEGNIIISLGGGQSTKVKIMKVPVPYPVMKHVPYPVPVPIIQKKYIPVEKYIPVYKHYEGHHHEGHHGGGGGGGGGYESQQLEQYRQLSSKNAPTMSAPESAGQQGMSSMGGSQGAGYEQVSGQPSMNQMGALPTTASHMFASTQQMMSPESFSAALQSLGQNQADPGAMFGGAASQQQQQMMMMMGSNPNALMFPGQHSPMGMMDGANYMMGAGAGEQQMQALNGAHGYHHSMENVGGESQQQQQTAANTPTNYNLQSGQDSASSGASSSDSSSASRDSDSLYHQSSGFAPSLTVVSPPKQQQQHGNDGKRQQEQSLDAKSAAASSFGGPVKSRATSKLLAKSMGNKSLAATKEQNAKWATASATGSASGSSQSSKSVGEGKQQQQQQPRSIGSERQLANSSYNSKKTALAEQQMRPSTLAGVRLPAPLEQQQAAAQYRSMGSSSGVSSQQQQVGAPALPLSAPLTSSADSSSQLTQHN